MIEGVLVKYLRSVTALSVHAVRAPQSESLPYTLVTEVSASEVSSMSGPSGLVYPRVQVDCYAYSQCEASEAAAEVKRQLDGFRGDMVGTKVQGCHWVDRRSLDEPTTASDDRAVFRVMQQFIVWYEE